MVFKVLGCQGIIKAIKMYVEMAWLQALIHATIYCGLSGRSRLTTSSYGFTLSTRTS